MSTARSIDVLAFQQPSDRSDVNWEYAEQEAIKFPQRFRDKCRALTQTSKDFARLTAENDRLFSFVVRNLISIVDNCRAAAALTGKCIETVPRGSNTTNPLDLTDAASDLAAVGTAAPAATEERPAGVESASEKDSLASNTLAGVYRAALHLLEELGVAPVDLAGQTYDEVMVDGNKIEDPFEVLESAQRGPAKSLPVVEVVSPLWIHRRDGGVSVIRRGRVCC